MAELETSLNQNKESPSASGGGLLMGALGLGTGLLNSIGSYLGMKAQAKEQRELLDYQWRNMTSPHAQVSNWAAEGFNPAAMFGNQSQPANVGSMPSITAPQFGVGTLDMSSLASYISAMADAKKKGVEIPNVREDTNSKIIDNDRKQYELELLRKYGDKKEYQALALAEQKVKLAMQQNDLNEQQKAINEYVKAKEAALQVTAEHQRDILSKELANKDIELKLRNEESRQRAAASKASASASYASAQVSRAQAYYMDALTTTENQMREGKVRVQQLSIDLQDLAKQMANRENIRDAATHQDKIHAIVTQCNAQGLINEKMQREIEYMITQNDWQSVQYAMGCLGQAVGMYTSVGNLSLNQLTSQQRLDIQRDFNRIYEQGQHHTTVNYKPDSNGNWHPVWRQEQ